MDGDDGQGVHLTLLDDLQAGCGTAVTCTNIPQRQADPPDGTLEERGTWLLRSHAAFDACQIEGLPARFFPDLDGAVAAPFVRIVEVAVFLADTGAVIRTCGYQACCAPDADLIRMQPREAFVSPESCYAILAHEMGHWTGHPSRLARETLTRRHGDEARAVEEILAELTAALTCTSLGIDHDLKADSTDHVGSCLRVLARDRRFVLVAAAHAQRACDWLWSPQPDAVPLDGGADPALP